MIRRAALLLVVVALVGGCGDDDEATTESVASAVEPQLAYLDPESTAVLAVDLRFDGRNWGHLRDLASRALRAYREAEDPEDRARIPPNLSGALNLAAGYAGLDFEDDIQPLLDGYVTVGLTLPPVPPLPPEVEATLRKPPDDRSPEEWDRADRAASKRDDEARPKPVVVYRTVGEGLREVVEKLAEGAKLESFDGRDDVLTVEDGLYLVGDDTILYTEDADQARAALERADADAGFPAARLADAEKQAGIADPFVLATADPLVARATVEEPNLQRALEEVPWLGAIRSLAGAARFEADRIDLSGVVSTDQRALQDDDLPLAPAGDLDLPRTALMTGASRDQSFTTTFLSKTARALFADSGFARAVERAERDLGVSFEDEVLRQFSCPSASQFDPAERDFGARSCVKDPDRMRELLPELSKHLPRILTSLQRLDTQGLVGLLLIAPDAPITPSFTALADIIVRPPKKDAAPEEMLYEVTGLRDDPTSEIAFSGPDKVVFGLIGDTFVVGSDFEQARAGAKLEGERLEEKTASAVRVPPEVLLFDLGGDTDEEALVKVLGDLVLTASADRSALRAKGRLALND